MSQYETTLVDDPSISETERVQHALFDQIITTAHRIAVVSLVGLGVSLLVPALRVWQMLLLTAVVTGEYAVIELVRWLVRRGQRQAGAVVCVTATMVICLIIAVVLNAPTIAVAVAATLIVIAALLISPRAALVPAVIGIGGSVWLIVSNQQPWLTRWQWHDATMMLGVVQSMFLLPSIAAIIMIVVLVADRFRAALHTMQEQRHAAVAARADQEQLNTQLSQRVTEQQRLLAVIRDLETPVIPVLPGVLVLPLVSHLDPQRLASMQATLLHEVAERRATQVLIDLTGVPMIDTAAAHHLIQLAQAVRLLGTQVALTGMSATLAHTLVQLKVDLRAIRTFASIEDALARHAALPVADTPHIRPSIN